MTNPIQYPNVKEGRTEINLQEGLTFISPAKGPDTYQKTMQQILGDNLQIPTGEQTDSLLHAAYCGPEEFRDYALVSNVRTIMKDNWIWTPNRNLWIPENSKNAGVFVVYDEKGVGLSEELKQGDLEKVLEDGEELTINGTKIKVSKDRKIRFASRDSYDGGVQNSEDFAKNGFVIANYLEAIDKLAEVSKTFNYDPTVWTLNSQTPEQSVSALGEYVGRLHVVGVNFGVGGRCHAFGVLA